MGRNNRRENLRPKVQRRGVNPKFRPTHLTQHARERLREPEQAGLREMDVVRAVKEARGNFFNGGEVMLIASNGKKVVVYFTDTLEARNITTIVGQDRMPAERKKALLASGM